MHTRRTVPTALAIFRESHIMRRTFRPPQRPISGLLPFPLFLNAVPSQPPSIEQPLNANAPDVKPKSKVPSFSTPKVKVQCLPDKVSEARSEEQQTVGNQTSNLGTPPVQMVEEALANRPIFSTPLVKTSSPLEQCARFSSLPQTVSSPLCDPLSGGKYHPAECNNRDEQQHSRYLVLKIRMLFKGAGVFGRPGQNMEDLGVFGTSRSSNELKSGPQPPI